MTRLLFQILVMSAAGLFSGCASIISDKYYPVTVTSVPAGAQIEILDEKGQQRFVGVTPATARLAAGEAYFDSHDYSVKVSKEGYEPTASSITSSVDGWYWGNILFGGLIGGLLVDPVTGAMYELDQQNVTVNLVETRAENRTEPKSNVSPVEDETSSSKSGTYSEKDSVSRLDTLNDLKQRGLISTSDYENKKKKILDSL